MAALGIVACGDGGSVVGRDGVSSCGGTQPCGGSPVSGTWSIADVCFDLGEYNLILQSELRCPGARATAVEVTAPDSAFTFKDDGTYSQHQNLTAEISFDMPTSCTGGVGCSDWARARSDDGEASYACEGTDTCSCHETVADIASDSGMYRVSGNNITINSDVSGAAVTMGYCIQGGGSAIHLITLDPRTDTGPPAEPTILRDIIARR
jgi:hypothetical protein